MQTLIQRFRLHAAARTLVLAAGLLSAAAAPASALIHRYSFNDGTANDSVGKANGRLVGGVTIVNGVVKFTGKDGERVELLANGKDGINVNALKAVTVEAWYTADSSVPGAFQRVFDFGSTTGLGQKDSAGKSYLMFIALGKTNSRVAGSYAKISDGSYPNETVAEGPNAATLAETHVAVVVDATTITLYLNGAQVQQVPLADRSLAKVSNDFALLGAPLYGNDATLLGSINEFRIYQAALSADQVAASFHAGPNRVAVN
jgi:hypothetical protein